MTSAYPLAWPEGWERTNEFNRKRGSFVTTYDKTMKRMMTEMRLARATGLVISSNVPVRQDGMPYADVARYRIADPGVALYFTRAKRQLVLARDVYESVYDNLHSLVLAVEAMRGLERHGGANMLERAFSGFAALPNYSNAPPPTPWWRVLDFEADPSDMPAAFFKGILLQAEANYRDRAKVAHPDAGGSPAQMTELNAAIAEARKVLAV